MANEISTRAVLNVNHGGGQLIGDITKTFDIHADGKKAANVQVLSTVAEDIVLGDMTWSETLALWVKNMSTTAAETIILLKGAVEFADIPAGAEMLIFPKADGTAIQAKSATGTPSLQVIVAKRA